METQKKFALMSIVKSGYLIKDGHEYKVESYQYEETPDEYNQSVVKFDSVNEAHKFIKDHDFWSLEPVEFEPEINETKTLFAVKIVYSDKTEFWCWNNKTSFLLENALHFETRQEAEQAIEEAKEFGDANGWNVSYHIYEFEA